MLFNHITFIKQLSTIILVKDDKYLDNTIKNPNKIYVFMWVLFFFNLKVFLMSIDKIYLEK